MIGDWRYLFRFALGVLFIWAALGKIADLNHFAYDVHNFHLLPRAVENVFAMVLPWIDAASFVWPTTRSWWAMLPLSFSLARL